MGITNSYFYEFMVFIYTCTANNLSFDQSLAEFCRRNIAGSYLSHQLHLWSVYFLSGIVGGILYLQVTLHRGEVLLKMMKIFPIFLGILVRFLYHIHMLRLVRGIGAFITVTVKMGKHLLHFSVVYLSILLPFALTFYALNAEDFKGFSGAMFSTFRVIFGHGDIEPFYTNHFTKLVYTIYILLTAPHAEPHHRGHE